MEWAGLIKVTSLSLQLFFKYEEDRPDANKKVWERLSPIHGLIDGDNFVNQLTGSAIKRGKLGDSIRKRKKTGFSYSSDSKSIYFNSGLSLGTRITCIWIEDILVNIDQAQQVFEQFSNCSFLSQARIYHKEYNHIQNILEPRDMELKGISSKDLPLIHNGLSAPLDGYIIDISNNPGRCIRRIGYAETVGSTMWLSPLFWKNSGTDKAQALKALGDYVIENGDIVKIHVQDKPFTEKEGKEAELQHWLLDILFADAKK